MTRRITFGADPEFFVRERATRTIIPACGLFGGGKGDPVMLSSEGGYLEDGVTIELNVAPQATMTGVRSKIVELMGLWHQRFPQHELVIAASQEFSKEELRKHRQAMEIGCSADLCAWTIRRAPQISDFGNIRFAGGHIHVGIDPWPEDLTKKFLIRWLDVFALAPFIRGADVARWHYYGRPGLYRETDYGVEWRSPDPSWISNASVSQAANWAVTQLFSSKIPFEVLEQRFNAQMNLLEVTRLLSQQNMGNPTAYPRTWAGLQPYTEAILAV